MECVCTPVATDYCTMLDTIGETLNINKDLFYSIILKCLRKRKLCAYFVPHLSTAEQKEQQMATCQDFVYNADRDHWFLRKPIMGMNHSASSTILQWSGRAQNGWARKEEDFIKFTRHSREQRQCCLHYTTMLALFTKVSLPGVSCDNHKLRECHEAIIIEAHTSCMASISGKQQLYTVA